MKIKIIILILISIVIVSNCATTESKYKNGNQISITEALVKTPVYTANIQKTATHSEFTKTEPSIQTSTPKIDSTQTPNPTMEVTDSEIPMVQLENKCARPQESIFLRGEETLVLKKVLDVGYNDLVLTNLQDIKEIANVGRNVSFSPNKENIAYIDTSINLLFIIDNKGQIQKSIPVNNNIQSVISWIDEDHLLIENMPLFTDGIYNPPATSIYLKISAGEQEELDNDYPDYFYSGGIWPHWGPYIFTLTVFNSTLSHVIYPAYDNLGGFPLILWDREKEYEVAKFRSLDPNYGGLPQWEKDGSHFYSSIDPEFDLGSGEIIYNFPGEYSYLGGMDFVRVSKDGELERMTFLTTQYIAWEEGYSLSPDEDFIAFWISLENESLDKDITRELAILEIKTGKIINLCISGGNYPHPPVWSPNGDQLLVTISDLENGISDVLITDLIENVYSQVAEKSKGIGWMVGP